MGRSDHTRKIGIFGGTFNPVHIGHVSIVRSFLQSGEVDELWILLTPQPPHKITPAETTYEERLKLLELAFVNVSNVKISTVENKLPAPSYTYRTLQYLSEKHNNVDFLLCIGEDSLQNFTRWKDYDKIIENHTLLVAERPGSNHSTISPSLSENVIFVEHDPVSVSSSEIRSYIKENRNVPQHLLPEEVSRYIKKKGLYMN